MLISEDCLRSSYDASSSSVLEELGWNNLYTNRKMQKAILMYKVMRINHYDFVALHSMWIIFLKGLCVLVRVEIIHKSKVVRAVHRHRTGVGSIPAGGPYS